MNAFDPASARNTPEGGYTASDGWWAPVAPPHASLIPIGALVDERGYPIVTGLANFIVQKEGRFPLGNYAQSRAYAALPYDEFARGQRELSQLWAHQDAQEQAQERETHEKQERARQLNREAQKRYREKHGLAATPELAAAKQAHAEARLKLDEETVKCRAYLAQFEHAVQQAKIAVEAQRVAAARSRAERRDEDVE